MAWVTLDGTQTDTASSMLSNSQQGGYTTPEQQGADYSLFGTVKNWFTGDNTAAENKSAAINQSASDRYNAQQAEAQRKFEAQQAEISRNWQEQMSNTSYQRMVKDAEAAGINPLYLVGSGNGASTPSGATASGTAASTGNGLNLSKKSSGKSTLQTAAMTALTLAKLFILLG